MNPPPIPTLDRKAAEVLMRHVNAIDLLLGAILNIVDDLPPGSETEAIRDGAYRTVNQIHVGVTRPIVNVFPDLDPDR
jgi:hypothetical protein